MVLLHAVLVYLELKVRNMNKACNVCAFDLHVCASNRYNCPR